jgi:hypothetical protein
MSSDNYFDYNSNTVTIDTTNLSDLVYSTIDISGGSYDISIDTQDWNYGTKRLDVRDNGKIPVDIWAKMYNNGVIDD